MRLVAHIFGLMFCLSSARSTYLYRADIDITEGAIYEAHNCTSKDNGGSGAGLASILNIIRAAQHMSMDVSGTQNELHDNKEDSK